MNQDCAAKAISMLNDSRLRPAAGIADDTASLLQRCGNGDRLAFRILYDRWSGRLHGIALRITRQAPLAADATHDAFVQVWQQAHRFDPKRGSAEAFLISLVRYRAMDIVRQRGREISGYEPEERADDTPDALAQLVDSTEGEALHRCLGLLDTERRRLIVMAFVEGLSHSELAEKLSVPLGTVKSWIRRSLLSLRECLAT
jgi:RNA polymerase sigma-70 factor, ECF subfamily